MRQRQLGTSVNLSHSKKMWGGPMEPRGSIARCGPGEVQEASYRSKGDREFKCVQNGFRAPKFWSLRPKISRIHACLRLNRTIEDIRA